MSICKGRNYALSYLPTRGAFATYAREKTAEPLLPTVSKNISYVLN